MTDWKVNKFLYGSLVSHNVIIFPFKSSNMLLFLSRFESIYGTLVDLFLSISITISMASLRFVMRWKLNEKITLSASERRVFMKELPYYYLISWGDEVLAVYSVSTCQFSQCFMCFHHCRWISVLRRCTYFFYKQFFRRRLKCCLSDSNFPKMALTYTW